jgi:hypothetical protein
VNDSTSRSADKPQSENPSKSSLVKYQLERLSGINEEIANLESEKENTFQLIENYLREHLEENPELVQLDLSYVYWYSKELSSLVKRIHKEQTGKNFKADPQSVINSCCECGEDMETTVTNWSSLESVSKGNRSHLRYTQFTCQGCINKQEQHQNYRQKERKQEEENFQQYVQHLKSLPYREYLQTEHWKTLSTRARKNAYYRCQLCNSRDHILNTHHRTYERRGCEYLSDLIVLCEPCHEHFHGIVKEDGQ